MKKFMLALGQYFILEAFRQEWLPPHIGAYSLIRQCIPGHIATMLLSAAISLFLSMSMYIYLRTEYQ